MSSTTSYVVNGMTCDHCVRAVHDEVSSVQGVTEVVVDLGSGTLTVASTDAIDDAAVRAAVEEAGYQVANR